nr:DUF5753 domain-containing protein [Actinomadura sp. KC345]
MSKFGDAVSVVPDLGGVSWRNCPRSAGSASAPNCGGSGKGSGSRPRTSPRALTGRRRRSAGSKRRKSGSVSPTCACCWSCTRSARGTWEKFSPSPKPRHNAAGGTVTGTPCRNGSPPTSPLRTRRARRSSTARTACQRFSRPAEYALSVIETGRTVTLSTPREMKRTLDVRMRRQELLRRREPLAYSAVIDESVLLRLVGGPGIMRRQLESLVEMAELPNVELFVQRLNVHREPLIGESFTLLKFDPAYDIQFPDVACIDSFLLQIDVQDDTITDRYGRAWEALRQASLSGRESMTYISRMAHEVWLGRTK